MRIKQLVLALLAIGMVGCGPEQMTTDAPHFEGLDPKVVAEVLSHPRARLFIDQSEDWKPNIAQTITLNFILCRDAMRAYRQWTSTGIPPALAPMPEPVHPQQYAYSDARHQYNDYNQAIQSGDPQVLLSLITGQQTCGAWIPARPGELSGPTIEEVLLGRDQ